MPKNLCIYQMVPYLSLSLGQAHAEYKNGIYVGDECHLKIQEALEEDRQRQKNLVIYEKWLYDENPPVNERKVRVCASHFLNNTKKHTQ